MAHKIAVSVFLFATIISVAQKARRDANIFEDQYVKMIVLPGWTVTSSPPEVKVTRGNYVLTINSIYVHASGVEGGRFGEATAAMPSVRAVRADVEGPWGTTCAQDQPDQAMIVTAKMSLGNLYTDDTKANVENGCKFPSDGISAWFGALFVGAGSESEYTITLAYNTTDVNELPKKNAPELTQVLNDAKTMLKTLELKPPVVISSVEPKVTRPGETIIIRGSGFNLEGAGFHPLFGKLPNATIPPPNISPDGRSMRFAVPTSRTMISCDKPGEVDLSEDCAPAPPDYAGPICPPVNDRHPTFCGVPFPPGTYELQIVGSMVQSNRVTLSVMPPRPAAVSISVLYPNTGLDPGESITILGKGFTASGNRVKIGAAVVSDVPSSDGTTLTFPAPVPAGTSMIANLAYYLASVANARGETNPILVMYRFADPDNPHRLHWQKGGIRINAPPQPSPNH
jgi:hypothetical protein